MKKLLSLLTLLVVAISASWAGTTPDYESYDWSEDDATAVIGTHGDITISKAGLGNNGNVSGGHYYIPVNQNLKNSDSSWKYFGISATRQITQIDVLYCENGSSTSTTNVAWIAWGKNVTPAQASLAHGTTDGTTGGKNWDNKKWVSIDLSGTDAYTVYLSRSIREFQDKDGKSISNFGDAQTFNILGLRVYLASGTTHTVTYDLGAATSGTVPTQDAVGEGSKFTVANAPEDLVAPEGKDFKCWNDGTDDYAEGDKYTMGTSDVTLTAVYADKYAVSYAAGDGTGTMDGEEVAEGKKITLPASTFTAPDGKAFNNWLCSADNNTYEAGAEYTMTAEATTFTAQWVGYDTYLLPATSGDAPTSGDAIAMQTGSFGGSMTALSENLSYTTNGLQFGTNSSTKASVTLNKKIQEGTVITLTLVSAGTSARGLKLYNSDGSKQITTLGWTSETEIGAEETFSYTVKASDTGIIGNSGFQLWRNNTVQLKSLTVAKCGDAVLETISIPEEGVLTYVTQNAVDFSTQNGAFKAYAVTNVGATSATTAEVGQVPAGTPLLIKGVAGDYDVEVIASASAIENLLLASDGTVTGGDNIYAYSKTAKKFKKVSSSITIPAGKCYLQANGGDALDIIFDGEATAINDVNANAETVAPVKVITAKGVQIGKFNVAGQQVK